MRYDRILYTLSFGAALLSAPALADPFVFNNGTPDGRMATASRPGVGTFEIESGDDFFLSGRTLINSATFTGLLPAATNLSTGIAQVRVEIYRVFPDDSDLSRVVPQPPASPFATAQVPARKNSPSDVALDDRDSAGGSLSFSATQLAAAFGTTNSLTQGSIHPKPNQTTGGNGPASGQEVRFDVSLTTPFDLAPGHYFFIPQVDLTSGDFLWLSSGTPSGSDLQAWARDQFLDPDWLRIGTDIVGGNPAPTFNLAFSLAGETIAEPASMALVAGGMGGLALLRRRGKGSRGRDAT
jgi:hypothetical protein